MDPKKIRATKAFEQPWYYHIELAPGLFTPGRDLRAVAETRQLLRNVDIEGGGAEGRGARCLDLGLQEGMVSILLERRGGSEIVGYDRRLRKARLALVQRALGTHFDLIGGMKLQDLPQMLAEQSRAPFDVVVFSGVLYHMFDPLGGLTTVRGLVRNGGICLIETTCAFDDSDTMHFNRAGRFTPFGLWFITPRLLEYLLWFLRLRPLDVVHLKGTPRNDERPGQGRVAIACRAVSAPLGEAGDEWITSARDLDFAEFLDWDAVESDLPPVSYDGSRAGLVKRQGGTVDVLASVAATAPVPAGPEQTRLKLADKH